MIHFVGTSAMRKPVETLLSYRPLWRHVSVHEFGTRIRPSEGVWIFIGADQYTPSEMMRARTLCDELDQPVWNHPSCALHRFDLLGALWRDGINDFAVWRKMTSDVRFPAFERDEQSHTEHPRLVHCHHCPVGKGMVVEHLDLRSSDGLYRKYSTFRVGDRFINRHLFFGGHWIVKVPHGDPTPEQLAEEEAFLNGPVHPTIVRAFELGGIQYGRVDYGLTADGRPQVWEINLNPVLYPRDHIHPLRRSSQERTAQAILDALASAGR